MNLARALILPQRLLMLDEPTASLDASARAALIDRLAARRPRRLCFYRLAELKRAGTAMIGVFHHPGDVEVLIDREIDLAPDAPKQETREDVAV